MLDMGVFGDSLILIMMMTIKMMIIKQLLVSLDMGSHALDLGVFGDSFILIMMMIIYPGPTKSTSSSYLV